MVANDQFLEPLKYYETGLKDLHRQNVEEYFDNLTNQSQIDTGSNKDTCNKYYAKKNNLDKHRKSLGATKVGIGFMIALIIIGVILGVIFLISAGGNIGFILGGIGALVVAAIAFILILTVFRKKKKSLQELINKLEEEVNRLQKEAYAQVDALNRLFTPKMAPELMEKSAPIIDFDEYLSSKSEERIIKQFKDKLDTSIDHSTLVVQSGNINTNPFLLRQTYVMEMKPETYHGSLVISYTRTVSDGNGGTKTVVVTQTLHATYSHPKPNYSVRTDLTYYTDAAPQLSFYRTPAGMVGLNEKQIQKAVKKEDKENTKKAEDALKKGENYTKFANSKFEAYINSEKRDNELEYRLLFTPLAQNNFVYSLSKHDDIFFTKNKCVTNVATTHDVGMDYSGDVSNYIHFDYEKIKENFINYNVNFFEGLYHDFIPLLNIPLYQQHQSAPFVSDSHELPISYYEAEVLVNKFEPSSFKPEECDTEVILKTALSGHSLNVTAYGFKAISKTEFVPVMGGDGIMHPVPVPYYDYQRVQGTSTVNLVNKSGKKDDNNNGNILYRGFIAMLLLKNS